MPAPATEGPRRRVLRAGANHSLSYLTATAAIARAIDSAQLDAIVRGLANVRAGGGRLFVLGVGGGAAHASHAVNDFRKICRLESYAPTDNVSEFTARANDDGWETSFTGWLKVSHMSARDALLVFSVSGGSRTPALSVNLVGAMDAACEVGAPIYGVTGAPGGVLAELADVAVVIEPPSALHTPLVESFQATIWHALVSHPLLALEPARWEALMDRDESRLGVRV
ncbi:MAG TPA: SIS domain-containing protein [Solirubrobacteraceae bacterium]|nr:SIS domain-containing protein [Solirubrobacteraceae bacterium]